MSDESIKPIKEPEWEFLGFVQGIDQPICVVRLKISPQIRDCQRWSRNTLVARIQAAHEQQKDYTAEQRLLASLDKEIAEYKSGKRFPGSLPEEGQI